ncbi:MAG: tetratricopeptide repeat protein [Spirochaetaceae bacterium]|jgi:tetratricopeptide (TPR) repeat protein|nr:tetratricopeptide repeat protein [Spirochaetaceae bacterium]
MEKMEKAGGYGIDPNDALAYNNRGDAYYNKGEYDRAVADYTEALRINPNNAIVYNNRGYAYKEKGEYDRAVADFTAALRINPNYAGAKDGLEETRARQSR